MKFWSLNLRKKVKVNFLNSILVLYLITRCLQIYLIIYRAQLYLTKREKEGVELELEKERESQHILKSKIETQIENLQYKGNFS